MDRGCFWSEAFSVRSSVAPLVFRRILVFGALAAVVWWFEIATHWHFGLDVTPFEFIGALLGLLLVLRTNSGYDRWYEARKLWGGIVNQSRNLSILGVAHGPADKAWQREFAKWTAAFPHVTRHSLRHERDLCDVGVLSREERRAVERAQHMPMYVAMRISQLLRTAVEEGRMDRFAFLQAEAERSQLIDHLGACERILKTPLAAAFSIEIRRFLVAYLVTLPLALVESVQGLTPLFTMLVAYPLLSLDQIGVDLQNPFSTLRVSHLPLDELTAAIELNVLAMVDPVPYEVTAAAQEYGAAREMVESTPAMLPIRLEVEGT